MEIIVIGALPSSLYNFRGELIKLLLKHNKRVVTSAATANENEISKINGLGASFVEVSINRNGLNPVDDIRTLFSIYSIYRKVRPSVVLTYTIKPLYGGE